MLENPNFEDLLEAMNSGELLNEMDCLNLNFISSVKSYHQEIPDFRDFFKRKIELCDQLINEYLQPYIWKRNDYIRDNPGIRLANDGSDMLDRMIKREKLNSQGAMKDLNFVVPGPFITAVVVPGKTNEMRIREAIEAENAEVNAANKLLGGKIFLERDIYQARSDRELKKPRKLIDRVIDERESSQEKHR